jgi:hypothetical protein
LDRMPSLSNTNPTLTGLRLNPSPRSEKLAINHLNHCTAMSPLS